jgi:hypothetical protein
MCAFGKMRAVLAQFESAEEILCICPSSHEPITSLEILEDGQLKGVLFDFHVTVVSSVIQIQPNTGPVDGGSIVQVIGANLPTGINVTCKFGTVVVSADLAGTSSSVSCKSPPHQGALTVPFYVGKQDLFSTGEVAFEYLAEMIVDAVLPSQGPVKGGTIIHITGRLHLKATPRCHVTASGHASCSMVSSSHLRMISPPKQ